MLREDGAIFISIDDNEVQNLRGVMDEIFGARNFITTVIWQKNFSPKSTAKHLSEDHDYIVLYARNSEKWRPNLIPRTSDQDDRYKNPDNDPRGVWTSGDLSARNYYSLGTYSVQCPSGRVIDGPPRGTYWRVAKQKFLELDADHRIWWGKDGDNVPRLKRFLSDVKEGMVPQTLWLHTEVGNTQEAKKEVVSICDFADSPSVFITPKPRRLIERILQIATDKDSLVLDSFAGSGTTGHAVLALNSRDAGSRRFVCVEMDGSICQAVTAQRLKRAVNGYTPNGAQSESQVPGLGGGFRYCTLGAAMFDEDGQLCKQVTFQDLARHVYFTETGEPLPRNGNGKRSPLIGIRNGTAYYLLFNGILGDRRVNGGNVLTGSVLASLPVHKGRRVVFGEGCRLSRERLDREGVVFKQIPYEVKVS
jgi:site-specific DNA-methyltransferase (adenine-specific)/adenine-specific DNA-methyltransferase